MPHTSANLSLPWEWKQTEVGTLAWMQHRSEDTLGLWSVVGTFLMIFCAKASWHKGFFEGNTHLMLFIKVFLLQKFYPQNLRKRRLGSYCNSIIVRTSHVTIHVNYKRLKCPVMVNEKTQKPAFSIHRLLKYQNKRNNNTVNFKDTDTLEYQCRESSYAWQLPSKEQQKPHNM